MRNSTFNRNVFVLALAFALAFPTGQSRADNVSRPVRLTPGIKAAMIGDSHVEALGPYTAGLLGVRGRNKTNKVFRYESHRDYRAEDWLRNRSWGAWVDEFDPQIVVIVLGTNEAMKNQDEDQLVQTFTAFTARFAKKGRLIFWVTPPQLTGPKYLANVRRAVPRVSGIETVDMSKASYRLKPKGKHLIWSEYRKWAAVIAKKIAI